MQKNELVTPTLDKFEAACEGMTSKQLSGPLLGREILAKVSDKLEKSLRFWVEIRKLKLVRRQEGGFCAVSRTSQRIEKNDLSPEMAKMSNRSSLKS